MSKGKVKAVRLHDKHDRFPETSDVDVSTWELDAVQRLSGIVSKALTDTVHEAVNEALNLATENNVEMSIAVRSGSWDGVLEVGLPLGAYEDEAVYWEVRLDDLITEEIEFDRKERLQAIRSHLSEIVERLNDAIAMPTQEHPELDAVIKKEMEAMDELMEELEDRKAFDGQPSQYLQHIVPEPD